MIYLACTAFVVGLVGAALWFERISDEPLDITPEREEEMRKWKDS